MDDERSYDSETWRDEPGANTGDLRENDPSAPGYTRDGDRVFRSQFQHANRSKRRDDAAVERIESDVENGWLNVRVGDGQWASVPNLERPLVDPEHQGRIDALPPAGTTPSHDRVSYSDPLADNMDPTAPGSPDLRP